MAGRGSKLADFLDSPGGAAYTRANNPLGAIQDSDAPAVNSHGDMVGETKVVGAGDLALADLARNATVLGPQAPRISAGNPYAGGVDAALDPASGYGHMPGFQGSGAQNSQVSEAYKNAMNYETAMKLFGRPGAPDPLSTPPPEGGPSSGGPGGSNFGFGRVRRR